MDSHFRPAIDILRDMLRWIWDGRPYLALPLVPLFIAALMFLMPPILECKERDARFLGLALQLYGFSKIVLLYNREAHRAGGNSFQNWWKNRPRLYRRSVHVVTGTGFSNGTSFASADAFVTAGPNASIKHRLQILEQGQTLLREQVAREVTKLRSDFQETSQSLRSANSDLEREFREVKRGSEASASHNARLNLSAVAFFLTGVAVATLSPEVATFLGYEMSCPNPLSFLLGS